jgi:hypothetical protein
MARSTETHKLDADPVLEADLRAQKYLGDFNALVESGYPESGPKAEALYRKAQFWLDRLNKRLGNA